MSDRAKIADRIVKLLRIAEADDGPQGRTARAIAKQLQERYRISEEEIEEEPVLTEASWIVGRKGAPWRATLATGLASIYDCDVKIREYPNGALKIDLAAREKIASIRIHFDFLVAAIEHMTDGAQRTWRRDRRRWGRRFDAHSFALGAASYVAEFLDNLEDEDDSDDEFEFDVSPRRNLPARIGRLARRKQTEEVKRELDLGVLDPQWLRIGYVTARERLGGPRPELFEELDAMPISARTLSVLLNTGRLTYVGDLLRWSSRDLRMLRGLGPKAIREIQDALLRVDTVLRPNRSTVR